MNTILLVIHLIIAIALVAVILVQRSEGGGLGIGGGMSGFMTGRETANLLTRATAVLAALFFLTSLAFAILTSEGRRESRSVIDTGTPPPAGPSAPAAPAPPAVPTPPAGDQ